MPDFTPLIHTWAREDAARDNVFAQTDDELEKRFRRTGIVMTSAEIVRAMERAGYQRSAHDPDYWVAVEAFDDEEPRSRCVWEDCDDQAVYCVGHAVEYADFRNGVNRSPAELERRLGYAKDRLQGVSVNLDEVRAATAKLVQELRAAADRTRLRRLDAALATAESIGAFVDRTLAEMRLDHG
jgi:hypothetical protein